MVLIRYARARPGRRIPFAGAGWFALYSAGILIPSRPRRALRPQVELGYGAGLVVAAFLAVGTGCEGSGLIGSVPSAPESVPGGPVRSGPDPLQVPHPPVCCMARWFFLTLTLVRNLSGFGAR